MPGIQFKTNMKVNFLPAFYINYEYRHNGVGGIDLFAAYVMIDMRFVRKIFSARLFPAVIILSVEI